MSDNVDEFIGSTKARLSSLEKRAEKWDIAIEALTQFKAKVSIFGLLAMMFVSFLMNYVIKLVGLF